MNHMNMKKFIVGLLGIALIGVAAFMDNGNNETSPVDEAPQPADQGDGDEDPNPETSVEE